MVLSLYGIIFIYIIIYSLQSLYSNSHASFPRFNYYTKNYLIMQPSFVKRIGHFMCLKYLHNIIQ